MKLAFTFHHVDRSENLMDYAEERIEKIQRFELQPMDVHFLIRAEGHEAHVEATVNEGRRKFKAIGSADDYYRAVEMVVNKLVRQLSKDKRRIKAHKDLENSRSGKLARLVEAEEEAAQAQPTPIRRVG